MGCDIHLYAERRAGGLWESADTWVASQYSPDEQFVLAGTEIYSERCYDLFAMLADVRNGRGFAGVRTGGEFVPVAEPRGLPEDCSALVRSCADHWDVDGHSHSHLTVAELLEYDWTQTKSHCGWVDVSEWARWRVSGKPSTWSGMISGSGVSPHSPEEFEKARLAVGTDHYTLFREDSEALAAMRDRLGAAYPVTQVTWTEPYYVSAAGFLSAAMPRLWRLGRPEDVRIVFWFDN